MAVYDHRMGMLLSFSVALLVQRGVISGGERNRVITIDYRGWLVADLVDWTDGSSTEESE